MSPKTTLIQTLEIRTGVYKNNSDSDRTNKDMSPEKQPESDNINRDSCSKNISKSDTTNRERCSQNNFDSDTRWGQNQV